MSKAPKPIINKHTGQHTRKCQCAACVLQRWAEYKAKVREMTTRKPPTDTDQMVPVRAHFRRHPGYMDKQPALKILVEGFIRGLVKEES